MNKRVVISVFCVPCVHVGQREHVPSPLQYTLATDAFQLGYTEDGHCKGDVDRSLPPPQRLAWDIPSEVRAGVCGASSHAALSLSRKNLGSVTFGGDEP